MANWLLEDELRRRDFLRKGGAGLVGVAAGGGLLAACGGDDDDGGGAAGNITNNIAKIRLERSPMRLHHDAGVGPLFEPYIADWNKKYPKLPLKTAYVAQDYEGTTQAQLAGGSIDYDVLFADTGLAQKWYDAGWVQALDDFPGMSQMLDEMDPRYPPLIRSNDDKVIALPYYSAFELFVYNAEHLDEIGAKPPTSWDEFVEQCRELKSNGVVDTPFGPFWQQEFNGIIYEFITEVISETGQPPFDDEDLSFTFADDPAAVATLERWKVLYDEGLVPRDVFTTAYGDVANIFGGGKATFTQRYALQLKGWADPEQSKVADVAKNAVMPGESGQTLLFGGYWMMPSATPNTPAAWQLMRYLAWKDRNGDPFVLTNLVCIDIGGSTPFEEVNTAPAVEEARAKWADLDAYNEQADKVQTYGRAGVQVWFPEFLRESSRTLQDVVRGRTSPKDGLASMKEFVDSERDKAG
jgi:ABC-type glycerol-3-phosphate transport system substrate-binding protein